MEVIIMNKKCTSPFVTTPLDDPSIINISTEVNNKYYAMVSVPWQTPGKLYSACEGLHQGTIFADLDQPYICTLDNKHEKECCDCE